MKNQNQPLITIIVPVYNTATFLDNCVKSIQSQTYSTLEIILINDGSTDNSWFICSKYAMRDNRIQVFNKPNGGVSSARNYGLRIAKGEYITFVDSDDTVSKNYVETLYRAIVNTGSSSSSSSRILWTSRKKQPAINTKNNSQTYTLPSTQAVNNMLYLREPNMNAPCKMFKRDILKGMRFPEESIGEDFYFTYLALSASSKVAIVPEYLYNYTQHSDSAVHKKFSESRLGDFRLSQKIYNSCPVELKQAARFRLFMSCFYVIANAPISYIFKDRKSERAKIIKKYRRSILFDKYATKKFKLIAAATTINITMAQIIYKTWIRIAR